MRSTSEHSELDTYPLKGKNQKCERMKIPGLSPVGATPQLYLPGMRLAAHRAGYGRPLQHNAVHRTPVAGHVGVGLIPLTVRLQCDAAARQHAVATQRNV